MRYKILYSIKYVGDRKLTVMDFEKGQILHFYLSRLDDIENTELVEYVKSEMNKIKHGHYDYTQ